MAQIATYIIKHIAVKPVCVCVCVCVCMCVHIRAGECEKKYHILPSRLFS